MFKIREFDQVIFFTKTSKNINDIDIIQYRFFYTSKILYHK